MSDCSFFGHLDYQTNKHMSAYLAGAPDMISWTPKGFYHLCMTMEKAGAINRVWISPTTTKDAIRRVNGVSPVSIKMMLLKPIFPSRYQNNDSEYKYTVSV